MLKHPGAPSQGWVLSAVSTERGTAGTSSSLGSDGASGAVVSSFTHHRKQLPHPPPPYACWAPRPRPGKGGFLRALTSLPTPTWS